MKVRVFTIPGDVHSFPSVEKIIDKYRDIHDSWDNSSESEDISTDQIMLRVAQYYEINCYVDEDDYYFTPLSMSKEFAEKVIESNNLD